MTQINPTLPTDGADEGTWGAENNAVHTAHIAETNAHDLRLSVVEDAKATTDVRLTAAEAGGTAASARMDGLATSVAAAAPAAATSDALAANGAASAEPPLIPFAVGSPWRLGVARTAKFAPDTDARNREMADVDDAGVAWMNSYQYSHPVNYASDSDPLATVTDTLHTRADGVPAGGSWLERMPTTNRIAAGSDRASHCVTPDRLSIIEHFGMTKVDDTHYNVRRRHMVNLLGSGIGPLNGTRAYGGSAIGGLIRHWEVDANHPLYTGEIRHPLAVSMRSKSMLYTGKRVGDGYGDAFDSKGFGLKLGYVWPATEQDYNSDTLYAGTIPMGSYWAIKPEVDINTLGLSPSGLILAKACQDYGVYVTDTSGAQCFYTEDSAGAANGFAQNVKANSSKDLKIIYKLLRVITNNAPFTPNGGRLSDPRRGLAAGANYYPPIRSTPPDPRTTLAYIDVTTLPPALMGWSGTAWVTIGAQTPTDPGTTTPSGPTGSAYLTETGDRLLTETGDYLILE